MPDFSINTHHNHIYTSAPNIQMPESESSRIFLLGHNNRNRKKNGVKLAQQMKACFSKRKKLPNKMQFSKIRQFENVNVTLFLQRALTVLTVHKRSMSFFTFYTRVCRVRAAESCHCGLTTYIHRCMSGMYVRLLYVCMRVSVSVL